jgi:hypothetical protein
MSMERFFYDGYRDEEAYEVLKSSPVFPLVRELEFKYGLKVLRRSQINTGSGFDTAWQLVHKNGIAVCKVYTHNGGGKSGNQLEYCYRSPFYKKERGESNMDKETIRSVKISSLMATLTRQNVVPSMDDMTGKKVKNIREAMELMKRALGNSNKSNDFTSNEIHALLLMALGKSPNSDWVKIDQNKCQEALDKYEEADRLAKVKAEESGRFFYNPFYMIGVDEFGDYLIGKFKLIPVQAGDFQYETVEPFKRYSTYESVPDLIPVMTMTKVAYEDKQCRKAGVIPVDDKYDEGLDAVFFYHTQPTHYDHAWMVTSCPT